EIDERADEGRMLAQSADRIVLDGALRLRAPQRIGGHFDVAQRVFFGAVIGHGAAILTVKVAVYFSTCQRPLLHSCPRPLPRLRTWLRSPARSDGPLPRNLRRTQIE